MVHESVRTSPTDYETAIRKIWGNDADAAPWPTKVRTKNPEPRLIWHLPMVGLKAAEVLKQYPLSRFEGSPQKAFLQVDADSMVICPSYQLLGRNFCLCISTDQVVTFCEACFSLSLGFFNIRRRDFCSREWDACISFWKLATFCNLLYKIMFFFFLGCQAAGIPSWAFQFAHFIPSQRPDGWGCSNGPELDVAPPSRGAYTTLSQTESWSCYCFEKLQQRQNLHNHLGDQGSFLQFMVMMQLGAFFFWVESNWFNSHHSYSSFYTSVALLTAVSRFCFCVRKAHRGEVRFWKRSWSWWAWTSQQQDCMYFFTWGANAEWKDPLLGNIISLGKKTHVSDIFVYLWSPFLFRLASISPFSLSLSGPIFFRKKKQCIQKGARWASFAASGEPFAWPQYLGKATVAPTLASRRRWVEPPPDVHRRSPIPNLPL